MIKSMTGFGRGESVKGGKKFTVEIKTVNHRFIDVCIKCPRSISFLEDKVREVILGSLHRGKVDVVIIYEDNEEGNSTAVTDVNLADSYVKAFQLLKERYDLKDDIGISLFAKLPDVIKIQKREDDHDLLWDILKDALSVSVDNLIKMREAEGENLKNKLLDKLSVIKEKLELIKSRAPHVVIDYKAKLEDRISALIDKSDVDDERLAMEVALFADKCSIDEEIIRLESHISQFRDTLNSNDAVGRKLDFLVQEINREINTIGSKANDLTITKAVIDVKAELEKIREQVQNIE